MSQQVGPWDLGVGGGTRETLQSPKCRPSGCQKAREVLLEYGYPNGYSVRDSLRSGDRETGCRLFSITRFLFTISNLE